MVNLLDYCIQNKYVSNIIELQNLIAEERIIINNKPAKEVFYELQYGDIFDIIGLKGRINGKSILYSL